MTDADFLPLGALARKIWEDHYREVITREQIQYMLELAYSPEKLKEQHEERGHRFTVACLDDALCGFASVQEKDKGSYFIHKFYVDTELHRRGIGKNLMQNVIDTYKPDILTLHVNRRNCSAMNFYVRQGFLFAGIKLTEIGEGFVTDDFIMSRILSPEGGTGS